jgi:microcystin-dependent protein
MSSNPYLGEIVLFSFNFAPRGWVQCNGQLLPINQNQALFALLGTTYGGNGQTTFALPDMRGRAALGFDQGTAGPGLSNYPLGQSSGTESITLGQAQMPLHSHALTPSAVTPTARCRSGGGNQQTPVGNVPAADASGTVATYSNAAPDASMSTASVAVAGTMTAALTGSSQPHDNRQPYLAMTFCIATQGVFPPH